MALVGGAGNPTGGSNPAGVGTTLNLVGDFAYAYNEKSSSDQQSKENTLDFTTGNYLFVGEWTVCGSINKNGVNSTGGIDQFYLSLNGITVMSLKTDTGEEDMPTQLTVPVIIPAYTHVEVSADCTINNADWMISNTLTGRVYA